MLARPADCVLPCALHGYFPALAAFREQALRLSPTRRSAKASPFHIPRKAVKVRFLLPALLLLAACAPGGKVASTGLDIPEVAPGTVSTETMKQVTSELSPDAMKAASRARRARKRRSLISSGNSPKPGSSRATRAAGSRTCRWSRSLASNYGPLAIASKARASPTHGSQWVGVSYREHAHTALADSEIVFVGYGMYAPEKGWNDYAGVDMRGKTARDPGQRSRLDRATGSTAPSTAAAMTYYGRWTYKFEEAARQGAAGALIIHDTFPASYGWGDVEGGWTGPQAYAERADGGADQTQVNGWVEHDAAKALMRRRRARTSALLEGAARQHGLQAGAAGAHRFDRLRQRHPPLRLEQRDRHAAGQRAAGRIRAAHRALGPPRPLHGQRGGRRHLQRRDRQRHRHGRRWSRSAEAHAKAGATAPRSLVFLAVTAEEQGLLGSEYYAANPVFPLARHGRRAQHGRALAGRPGARRHRDRRRQERARRASSHRAGRTAAATATPDPTAAGRLLLPLRPFQPRQARRADVLRRRRRGLRRTAGEAAGGAYQEPLHRERAYHAARRRVRSRLGLARADAGPGARLPPGAHAGDQHILAQLAARATNSAASATRAATPAGGC